MELITQQNKVALVIKDRISSTKPTHVCHRDAYFKCLIVHYLRVIVSVSRRKITGFAALFTQLSVR